MVNDGNLNLKRMLISIYVPYVSDSIKDTNEDQRNDSYETTHMDGVEIRNYVLVNDQMQWEEKNQIKKEETSIGDHTHEPLDMTIDSMKDPVLNHVNHSSSKPIGETFHQNSSFDMNERSNSSNSFDEHQRHLEALKKELERERLQLEAERKILMETKRLEEERRLLQEKLKLEDERRKLRERRKSRWRSP